MILVYKETNKPVQIGDEITDFRGEKSIVTGWQAPTHLGSTGRVHVKAKIGGSFYPSVFGLEWRNEE